MIDFNSKKVEIWKIAEKHKIKFIVLFGSRAKDAFREDSDFDVAVYMDGFNDMGDMGKYSDVLSDLARFLEVFEDKIDLTDLKNANLLLRYEITQEGKLLFGSELDYLQLKAFAFRDYIAAKSLLNLEYFIAKKKQKLFAKNLK